MQKLILFDFDGTLADTAPDLAATANKLRMQRQLQPLPLEALRAVSSQGARGLLRVSLGLQTTDPGYNQVRDQFLDIYKANITAHSLMFPGMQELLDTIAQAGFSWGIVTNKAENLTHPLVNHFGLASSCRVLVGGDTTPHIKPHPEPLLHAAKLAGVAPSQCIYIGDDERDIVAGKAAGMPTIAAAWGYCEASALPSWQADAIAQTPADVWPIVQKLWPNQPAKK